MNKKGKKKGQRPIIWICCAIYNNELVCERYSFVNTSILESRDIATNSFVETYKTYPKKILGPFYDKKCGMEHGLIKYNLDNLKLKPNQQRAIFNNWIGIVTEINDNLYERYFIFLRPKDNSSLTKYKKADQPLPGIVNILDLEFLD